MYSLFLDLLGFWKLHMNKTRDNAQMCKKIYGSSQPSSQDDLSRILAGAIHGKIVFKLFSIFILGMLLLFNYG